MYSGGGCNGVSIQAVIAGNPGIIQHANPSGASLTYHRTRQTADEIRIPNKCGCTTANMSFQFVDNSTLFSHATRKQIRSHAAQGRNAGKALVPVSQRKELKPRVAAAAGLFRIPATALEAYESQWHEDVSVEIERPVGDGLSFPVRLAPGSTRLARKGMFGHLSQKYNIHRGLSSLTRAFRTVLYFIRGARHAPELSNALAFSSRSASIWVQYMLLDEACMFTPSRFNLHILPTLLPKSKTSIALWLRRSQLLTCQLQTKKRIPRRCATCHRRYA